MNKIPIVFTFDKRIIPAASIAIKSLAESADCDTIYDIYILHSDIELKYQKEISKLTDKTRHTVSFKYVDSKIFKNYKKSSHSWSEIVYYRLLIADYLPMLDKAIYSDCDVFFKQDLSEVYNVNIENYEIAAVAAEKNTKDAIGHKYFPENQNEFIYWSGFLVLNCKKIREENYFEKFQTTALKFKDRLRFFDLDVINITCNNIFSLPFKYCTLESVYEYSDIEKAKEYKYLKEVYTKEELNEAKNHPAIIHYAGELGKPWRRKKIPAYYKKMIIELPHGLKKFTFRDFRKRLFSKL